MKKIVLTIAVVLLLSSCNNNEQIVKKEIESFSNFKHGKKIVSKNNDFAFTSFKKIIESNKNENTLYSPVSLSLALGMAYNGAETDSKSAFEQTLKYAVNREEVNKTNKNLIEHLTDDSRQSIFKVANSMWLDENFPVKDNFIKTNKENYFAKVSSVNFKSSDAKRIINNWCSDNTNKKITKIVDNTDGLKLFLANALYFKGIWKNQFEAKNTKKEAFTNTMESKDVDMMFMEETVPYFENEHFSSIRLPYKDDKFAMTLVLPKGDDFNKSVEFFIENKFSNVFEQFEEKKVLISVPKFKFSFKQDLKEVLSDMGLSNVFTDKADFSGISDINVLISSILQKTYIDVNEEGTEAAAVTGVGFEVTSVGPLKTEFKANKPFLFMITEKETNSICFIGNINMPDYEE